LVLAKLYYDQTHEKIKSNIIPRRKRDPSLDDSIWNSIKEEWNYFYQNSMIKDSKKCLALFTLGIFTGFCSGLFGIGGGFVIVPVMGTFFCSQEQAQGTSLMSMILPAAMASFVHYRKGNVITSIVPFLISGTAVSSWIVAYFITQEGTEIVNRIVYCFAMGLLGFMTLRLGKKPVKVPVEQIKGVNRRYK